MSKGKVSPLVLKLLIPIVIALGIYVFYKAKKKEFLQSGLPNVVEKKTDNLYKISYDSISVNEVAGNLYIKNLRITGDTLRQMQLIRQGDTTAAKVIIDVYVPLLQVEGFRTARALLSKQLKCREVIISDPVVKVYIFPGQAKNKDEAEQQKELYQQILGNLKMIEAENISVNNSSVTATDFSTGETKFSATGTTVNLYDVLIDSTYRTDTSRTLFCKQIKINAAKVILGEKNNTAQVTNLGFSTASKVVSLARLDYDAFKNNGFFKTSLSDVYVDGVEWKGPAERSDLRIRNVVLKQGTIETLAGTSNKSLKPNSKILTGWIKSFSLERLLVKSFNISHKSEENKQPLSINNNSLLLKGININANSRLDETLLNDLSEAEFYNDNVTLVSADKFYKSKINGFKINTKAKEISIKRVLCIPQFAEEEFAKRAKVQRDRYDVDVSNIVCRNVDIGKLFRSEFYASAISVGKSSVKVYRDLSYRSSNKRLVGSYPHQLLYKLKTPVNIETVTGNGIYIAYKEKTPITDTSGTVTFHRTKVNISNITNLPAMAGEKTTLKFTSDFLGALPVTGSLIFKLDEWQKGSFQAEAIIAQSFDARMLNQLTQPMSLVKINSGVFDYVKCNLELDNYVSTGKLIMTYRDFKIALLKKKGEEVHKKNTMSILANVLLKNKNAAGEKMRVASIQQQRDVETSFFNFIWVSIFGGAQQIFGVPQK